MGQLQPYMLRLEFCWQCSVATAVRGAEKRSRTWSWAAHSDISEKEWYRRNGRRLMATGSDRAVLSEGVQVGASNQGFVVLRWQPIHSTVTCILL